MNLTDIVRIENLQRLTESSLARVWDYAKPNSGRIFSIITAFRAMDEKGNVLSHDDNLARNAELKQDIRKQGFGFFTLEGHWVENQGTSSQVDVQEQSLFTGLSSNQKNGPQILHDFVLHQIRKWNQDAAIIKDNPVGETVDLIFQDGSRKNIGKFTPMNVSQAYSKMKKGPQNRTFIFEKMIEPSNWMKEVIKQHK